MNIFSLDCLLVFVAVALGSVYGSSSSNSVSGPWNGNPGYGGAFGFGGAYPNGGYGGRNGPWSGYGGFGAGYQPWNNPGSGYAGGIGPQQWNGYGVGGGFGPWSGNGGNVYGGGVGQWNGYPGAGYGYSGAPAHSSVQVTRGLGNGWSQGFGPGYNGGIGYGIGHFNGNRYPHGNGYHGNALPHGGYSRGGAWENNLEYSPSQYSYQYKVDSPKSGDVKSQEESKNGDVVKGSYSLREPDGSTRVVNYASDSQNGFNAEVKKIGKAAH